MFDRRNFLKVLGGTAASIIPAVAQNTTNPPPNVPPNPGPHPVLPVPPRLPGPTPTKPVVAIALAGGGAKGSFEVGAVRYLYNQGIRPNIICGTSVGAINAVKLAEGEGSPTQGLAGLESIWLSLRSNSDMYVETPWLTWLRTQKPNVYKMLPAFLLSPSAEGPVSITGTSIGSPLWVSFVGLQLAIPYIWLNYILATAGDLGLCQDLSDVAKSISQQSPQALYDLSPIHNLLGKNLDLKLVQQWAADGRKLRLATVALESGRVRYATESGQLIDRDGTVVVSQLPSLALAVNASAALPSFFIPQKLGNEMYVDGGIRDVMPTAMAVQLGADVVFAVNDSPPLPPDTSYEKKSFLDIAERSVLGIALDEVVHEATSTVSTVPHTPAQVQVIQCTYAQDSDTVLVHPALVRINMSYGYMRAADNFRWNETFLPTRSYDLSDRITQMRRLLFQLENLVLWSGPRVWNTHVPILRWGKGMLSLLIQERYKLGGAVPPDVDLSWMTWEQHIQSPPNDTPFKAMGSVPGDIQLAHYIPQNNTFLTEDRSDQGQLYSQGFGSSAGNGVYVSLGNAAFPVCGSSAPEMLAAGVDPSAVRTIPMGSIFLLAQIPWEGTLIKEKGSDPVYVIQNGEKSWITSQAVFTSHGFSWDAVLTAPPGSLAVIPNGPAVIS